MSKFLTPPVWYDKNGEENQSLVNAANAGVSGPTNIAFGLDAKSGTDNDSHSCIAIGYQATATGRNAIAIGSYDSDANPVGPDAGTRATGSGTIVIGGGASASGGGIAIGDGASATANQIQLGNPNSWYNLQIGSGTSSTVQAGGYKIGTTTIIDSNRNISGNSFLSTGYIQCPVLQISSKFVGSRVFDTKTNQGLIEITIGDSTSAIYLATIIAEYKEQDGTSRYYRQHFGIIPSMAYSRNSSGGIAYPPDTAIEVPMITRVNHAPYDNTWKMAHLEFSPQSSNYPLYCDFSQVMRSDFATGPYSSDIVETGVYVHKIIDFPSPIL